MFFSCGCAVYKIALKKRIESTEKTTFQLTFCESLW